MKLIKTSNKYEVFDKDKLIASSDNKSVPSINFENLSEEDCKKIGWVDVEKLARKYANITHNRPLDAEERYYKDYQKYDGFIDGFKAAQSLNEKKFSKEDMWYCFLEGKISKGATDIFDKFIQSLSQPKVFNIEVEMGLMKLNSDGEEIGFPDMNQPKITNNSIKVIKVL